MFDFLKKKEPLLFTMDITLDDLSDDAASARATTVKIKPDGSVYAGARKIGKISNKLWEYILQFGTPKEMRRITPLVFQVDVPGEMSSAGIADDTSGHPYTYRCGSTDFWPCMMPKTEYDCELVDQGDHFDVMVLGVRIGQMDEVPERKRLDKLRSMIKSGYKTTARIAPQNTYCDLIVNVRKA